MVENVLIVTLTLTTVVGFTIAYRERQSGNDFLRLILTAANKIAKMEPIVKTHGCAPRELVAAGTEHTCDDCGTTWRAQEVEVEWHDKSLRNVTRQAWDVADPAPHRD